LTLPASRSAGRIPVIWTRQAAAQLSAAHEFIARDRRDAADRQLLLIYRAAESLGIFPEKGRPGRIPGTRELVVVGTSYLIAYRIRESSIRILGILHGARRWPEVFSES
jgi:toxin ParE1/3/4